MRIVVISLFFICLCSCIRGGGSIKLSPSHMELSWEQQSFQVTSSDYYYVSMIMIDNTKYNNIYNPYENIIADTQTPSSAEAEWVHWRHQEGEDYSTVTVDENLTGKERTACIYVFDNVCGGVLSITQLPKE